MASAHLSEPVVARSGSSIHSIHSEDEFTQQVEENPLEIRSHSSRQPTPSHVVPRNPIDTYHDNKYTDEPPPPYEEPSFPSEPQIAPVEYSCENSPQLVVGPHSNFPEPPPRNPARLSREVPGTNIIVSPISPEDEGLYPSPLSIRPASSQDRVDNRPTSAQPIPNAFSSAKAREAGFEIERQPSSTSSPSIDFVSSTDKLRHSREPGKLTAYLIPFPTPRLKGVKPENTPTRFLVYTPPPPPLSKPAPGEKESPWHKTQRLWQEDVRKATITHASSVTWAGFKAKTTILIGKGIDMTKSSNLEFLNRVSDGAISEAVEEAHPDKTSAEDPVELDSRQAPTEIPAELDATSSETRTEAPTPTSEGPPKSPNRISSSVPSIKDSKAKGLEELTLVFPPSLDLSSEEIRTEFAKSLLRTRDKSRKEAIVASALIPVAAAVDASLILTLGGLTEISGVWAYTSIRGTVNSKRMVKGLAAGQDQANEKDEHHEVQGCTCGNHEHDFGPAQTIPKTKGKSKKNSINLHMQQNSHLEILRRYLELKCLKRDFNMFPTIEEAAGDVNEAAVLEAIGWKPTRRGGTDLEMQFKDKVEKLTPEQDEQWQEREAKEDLKRIMKKGAAEWVQWCKSFQKDPEAALKK
ncbi:hypothetical protein EJ04DRAFT_507580 [Polyplosphaeria fusca]|uniref:Uncharacterized protein n=1 Tax=Polyplosphaeria fusca TaxID=682080 RepID=A0A9P4R8H6_9PLEO|nr:hypothetical protein EJ04DRAFT_507580 [Polyplosphaeria fusca]